MKNRFGLTLAERSQGVVQKAARFAFAAHFGQTRKYTEEPYFKHCQNVAKLVAQRGGDLNQIAAGFLHDTVEDTDAFLEDIHDDFGPIITRYVDELTDAFSHEDHPYLNRKERKELECRRIRQISFNAQCVKLCDLIDNTRDIIANDPQFAVVYLAEKVEILKVFRSGVLKWGKYEEWNNE